MYAFHNRGSQPRTTRSGDYVFGDVGSSWITPRLECILSAHYSLSSDDIIEYCSEISYCVGLHWHKRNLPKCAHNAYLAADDCFRDHMIECFRRLGGRIMYGRKPEPNCTGEEVALHCVLADCRRVLSDDQEGYHEIFGCSDLPEEVKDIALALGDVQEYAC
jgi:hypothetical protein